MCLLFSHYQIRLYVLLLRVLPTLKMYFNVVGIVELTLSDP